MIDPTSGRAIVIATGGTRGDGVATTSDGRLLVSHSDQVDVVLPVFAPEIVASTPADGDVRIAPLPFIEIAFDQRSR